MRPIHLIAALAAAFAMLTVNGVPASAADQATYTLVPDEHGMVLKAPDGKTVFRYMTKKPKETNLTANSVCCLYPVFTPSGVRAVDFAPGDHRHGGATPRMSQSGPFDAVTGVTIRLRAVFEHL